MSGIYILQMEPMRTAQQADHRRREITTLTPTWCLSTTSYKSVFLIVKVFSVNCPTLYISLLVFCIFQPHNYSNNLFKLIILFSSSTNNPVLCAYMGKMYKRKQGKKYILSDRRVNKTILVNTAVIICIEEEQSVVLTHMSVVDEPMLVGDLIGHLYTSGYMDGPCVSVDLQTQDRSQPRDQQDQKRPKDEAQQS